MGLFTVCPYFLAVFPGYYGPAAASPGIPLHLGFLLSL